MKKTNDVNPDLSKSAKPNKFVTTRDLPVEPLKPAKDRVPSKMAVSTHNIQDVNDAQEQKEIKEKTALIKKQRKAQKAKAKKDKK